MALSWLRPDDAETVRAERGRCSCAISSILRSSAGTRWPGFGKTEVMTITFLTPLRIALLYDGRHRRRAGADHGEFDAGADFHRSRHWPRRLNRLVLGVDRVETALGQIENVPEDDVADRVFPVGGAITATDRFKQAW